MNLKKYSDFSFETNEETIVEKSVEETVTSEDVKVEEKVDNVKEELLLSPEPTSNIEILEERIIKFNTGNIKDILETLKTKYSDTDYFIRKKDNQLHIVKYNESLDININEFVNSLLRYYSTGDMKKIIEGIKVKGNTSFSIIENMKPQYSGRFITDLTNLLTKK